MKRTIVSSSLSSVPPTSNATAVASPQATASPQAIPLVDLAADIPTMMNASMEILRREIRNLMMESTNGKLGKASATDLVQYIKLFNDLLEKEDDFLENLSDDELEEIVANRKNAKSQYPVSSEGTQEEE